MPGADPLLSPEGVFTPDGYARLLREVYRQRVSGLLVLTEGAAAMRLYLMNGSIAYGTSNQARDRLGDILLAKGVITREQHEESSRLIRETGKKQGTILVQMGAIEPKDLFRGLILQVTEIAESPFRWKSGRWIYARAFDGEEEMIILKIHPGAVIREGTRAGGADGRFLPPAGLSHRIVPDPPFEEDGIGLTPLERRIIAAVPAGKTPADVAGETGTPPDAVAASFAVLTLLGFIAPAGEEVRTAGAPPESGAPAPAAGDAGEWRAGFLALSQRLPRMTHYEVLGVNPEAAPDEIRGAYFRQAKEYHPDRFARPALEDLAPLAGTVFSRVNEAHEILSDGARRREYDRSLKNPVSGADAAGNENDPALAAEQFRKGTRLLKCGETRDAVEAFRWAVRLNPDKAAYHAGLGRALLETGQRLKEAEGHLKQALSLEAGNADFYVTLGLVYRKGRRFDQAGEYFERALKVDPGHEAARRELRELDADRRPPPDRGASILGKLLGR